MKKRKYGRKIWKGMNNRYSESEINSKPKY